MLYSYKDSCIKDEFAKRYQSCAIVYLMLYVSFKSTCRLYQIAYEEFFILMYCDLMFLLHNLSTTISLGLDKFVRCINIILGHMELK